MPDFNFKVAVGQSAPDGAEVNPLTNIRPLVPPVGRVKTQLIDPLTGSYSAIQTARIARTFFALLDAGILQKLDGLFIRGLTANDSLMNWVNGRPAATNFGAAFTAGQGFALDGVDDYINMNVSFSRFTQSSATVFVLAPSVPAVHNAPLIGRGAEGVDSARIIPYLFAGGEAGASGRLNGTETALAKPYTGPVTGLWGVGRLGEQQNLTLGGNVLAQGTVPLANVNSSIVVGRHITAFGQFVVSAFGYGGYLTPAEMVALNEILAAHHRAV